MANPLKDEAGNPRPDINTPEFWNKTYGEEHPTEKRRLDDERLSLIQGWARNFQRDNERLPDFLDVGCGFGEAMRYLHWRVPGMSIAGVDIADKAIELGEADKAKLTYTTGNAYQLPYPDQSKDLIWIGETLEHLAEPEKAVKEAMRVLRKGGWLLVSMPYKMKNDTGEHLQEFNFEDVVKYADQWGRIRYVDVVAGGLSLFGVIEKQR